MKNDWYCLHRCMLQLRGHPLCKIRVCVYTKMTFKTTQIYGENPEPIRFAWDVSLCLLASKLIFLLRRFRLRLGFNQMSDELNLLEVLQVASSWKLPYLLLSRDAIAHMQLFGRDFNEVRWLTPLEKKKRGNPCRLFFLIDFCRQRLIHRRPGQIYKSLRLMNTFAVNLWSRVEEPLQQQLADGRARWLGHQVPEVKGRKIQTFIWNQTNLLLPCKNLFHHPCAA